MVATKLIALELDDEVGGVLDFSPDTTAGPQNRSQRPEMGVLHDYAQRSVKAMHKVCTRSRHNRYNNISMYGTLCMRLATE